MLQAIGTVLSTILAITPLPKLNRWGTCFCEWHLVGPFPVESRLTYCACGTYTDWKCDHCGKPTCLPHLYLLPNPVKPFEVCS